MNESEIVKGATMSGCSQYRYVLTRQWSVAPALPFIMLNPSTATGALDDPTIRRCMGFARREGAGGIIVGNLFGLRATDPRELALAADPFGPDNEQYLWEIACKANTNHMPIVCAWGEKGDLMGAARRAMGLMVLAMAPMVCLGRTAHGQPRHPLYVAGDQLLENFSL